MNIELRRIAAPALDVPLSAPAITETEHRSRCDALYAAAGLDWVAVYGDREHFANLVWLCGYDPRFEEALLMLGPGGTRVLLAGIEGLAYGADVARGVEIRFYHPFGIAGQPHVDSPPLRDLLREIGVARGSTVGFAGWKSADPRDLDPQVPAFVPSILVRIMDDLIGGTSVDVTRLLIDPKHGLRNVNSAAQLAVFEWGAARASASVLRVIQGVRPGMTELDAAGLMRLQGEPVTMHPIVSSSNAVLDGLRSATSRTISEGDAITCGVGMWGGLNCRAGIMNASPSDEVWGTLVEPYFRAIATWWSSVRIGLTGHELDAAIRGAIGDAAWNSFVNPGHLTSHDEWLYGFSLPGSTATVASGWAMQCDIIPNPLPPGCAINCEDSLAIADASLRDELATQFPDVWSRVQSRRVFMQEALGIVLHDEVLPFSVAPAYLPPSWLSPDLVCTVAG